MRLIVVHEKPFNELGFADGRITEEDDLERVITASTCSEGSNVTTVTA